MGLRNATVASREACRGNGYRTLAMRRAALRPVEAIMSPKGYYAATLDCYEGSVIDVTCEQPLRALVYEMRTIKTRRIIAVATDQTLR